MAARLGTPSLATTHPAVARQALFDATTISAGSNKKMPWKCDRNHEWQAVVSSRTRGSGCPFCANKAVLPGYNDLETTNPELAAEAQFDARTITRSSHKKLLWRCDRNHEWQAVVSDRTRGRGCPFCAGNAVLPGFNDLQTTHPDIAKEADFDATTVTFGSVQKMPWKCTSHGHEWNATPNSRTGVNQTGCPVCSNNEVLAGFNDLQTTHPDLALEAEFDPTTIKAGSNKKMPWKCTSHGHEWEAVVYSRTGGDKVGCPVCANRQALAGFNDLQTKYPEVAAEAMFDPTTVTFGSHTKLPWKCTAHGHEWNATVTHRTSRNQGCPVCANAIVLSGFNDLQTTHPEIAKEADFDPTTVLSGSNKKMPWKCTSHGHEWNATVVNRTRNNSDCPVCANAIVLSGFNDLQTKYPEVAAEAMFDPTTVTFGSVQKMPWKCTAHGHEWNATVTHRTSRNQGCPVCANAIVLSGFNDLQTKYPEVAAEAMFDPTTVLSGSNKKMPWKCTAHGHEWNATAVSRTGGHKTGCPVCAVTGFNPGDSGWLYLMRHPEWLLLQVGITNHPTRRLKKHASNGWEVLDIRGPMDGFLTQQWEASILRWLSYRNIARASSGTSESPDFGNPNSGEAWQASDFNVTSLREIMDLVEADEQ